MTNQLHFPATLGRLPGIQWRELIMKSSSFRNKKTDEQRKNHFVNLRNFKSIKMFHTCSTADNTKIQTFVFEKQNVRFSRLRLTRPDSLVDGLASDIY